MKLDFFFHFRQLRKKYVTLFFYDTLFIEIRIEKS